MHTIGIDHLVLKEFENAVCKMLAPLFSFKICVKMNFAEDIKDIDPLVSLLLVGFVSLQH